MNFCNPSRVKQNGAGFGSPRFFVPAARPGNRKLRAVRIRRKAQGCPQLGPGIPGFAPPGSDARRRADQDAGPGDPTGLSGPGARPGLSGPGARRKADQDAGLTYPMLCGIISGSLKEEIKQ